MSDIIITTEISSKGADEGAKQVGRSLNEIKQKSKEMQAALSSAATEGAQKVGRSLEDIRQKSTAIAGTVRTAAAGVAASAATMGRSFDDIRAKVQQTQQSVAALGPETVRQFKAFGTAVEDIGKKYNTAANSGGEFARVARLAIAYLGVRELMQASDAYTNMNSKLRTVIDSESELVGTRERLLHISNETRTSMESTVSLYTRVTRNAEELGVSQEKLMRVTELANKAIQVGGSTSSEAASGVLQFSQALAAGTLQGDELRSIMENMPVLAKAIADGMGTTIGKLRQLGQEGKLASKDILEAVLSQGALIDEKFGKVSVTIGQAFTVLKNNFQQLIGDFNDSSGAAGALSDVILVVADNLGLIAKAMGVIVGFAMPSLFALAAVKMYELAKAAAAFAVAMAANPIVLVLSIIAAGIATLVLFNTQIEEAAKNGNLFAEAYVGAKDSIGNFFGAIWDWVNGPLYERFKDLVAMAYTLGAVIGGGDKLDIAVDMLKQRKKAWNGEGVDDMSMSDVKMYYGQEFGPAAPAKPGKGKGSGGGGGGKGKDTVDYYAQAVKQLERENELLQVSKGLREEEKTVLELKDRMAEKGIKMSTAQEAKLRGLVQQQKQLQILENDTVNKTIKGLQDENALLQMPPLLRAQEKAIMDLRNQAEREGFELTTAQIDALKGVIAQKQQIEEQQAKINEETRQWQQIVDNANRNIQQAFSDTFESIFTGGVSSFSDLAKSVKAIFIKLAAEIATMMVFKPLVGDIVGSLGLGSLLGGDSSSASGAGGTAANGVSLLSKLTGGLPSMGNFLAGNIGGFNAVNQFGAKYLGTGIVGQGGITGGASLSGIGMNAGIGSLISSFAGLGSGNGIVDTGLSLAGSYGGSALAGLMGASSFAGPAGIAGAIALQALGGLFKKKPSSKMQTGSVDLVTGDILRGGLTGNKFSPENEAMVTTLSQLASGVAGMFGAKGPLQVAAGNRNGLEYAMTGDKHVFDADNGLRKQFKTANDFVKSLAGDFATQMGKDVSESMKTALSKIDFGGTEEELKKALADLSFAFNFDQLGKTVEELSALDLALKELVDSEAKATETAERLGLSVGKVKDAFDSLRQNLRDDFNKSVGADVLGILNPVAQEMVAELKRYQDQLKDAQKIGGDLRQVELLHELRKSQILQKNNAQDNANLTLLNSQKESLSALVSNSAQLVNDYTQLSATLSATMLGMRLGDASKFSTEERLRMAQAEFNAAVSAKDGTKANQLSSTVLSLAKDYYASTAGYAAVFDEVNSGLTDLFNNANEQISIESQTLATAKAQLSATERSIQVLQDGFSSFAAILARFNGGATTASIINGSVSVSSGNANEALVKSIQSGAYSYEANKGTIDTLFSSVGAPAADNNGGRSAYLEANPSANAAFKIAAKQLGIPGFYTGGITPPGSAFIVGENGPEIMESSLQMRVTPMRNYAQQQSSGTSDVVPVLRELISEVRLLAQDIAQGNADSSSLLLRTNSSIQSLSNSMERVAAMV